MITERFKYSDLKMLDVEKHFFQMKQNYFLLRLNVSPIPVQIVEFCGVPSSYAVLKNFHGLAWWKF